MAENYYFRDTWAEVDLDRIQENVRSMKKHLALGTNIIAVVKANGYGHGDYQVAKTALEAGATSLAVALLDEAIALRQQGIKAPILVLGATRPQDITIAAQHQISLTVFRADWLREAKKSFTGEQHVSIHIKLDTGMGRLGIKAKQELQQVSDEIKDDERFILEGVFTHFATADELDTTYFETQYNNFLTMLSWFPVKPKIIHCGNSATGLRFPNKVFNAVRLGIAMYGLSPSVEMKSLLPFTLNEAFSLHSRLVHVKKLSQGESVSYGATYTAQEEEWIGTVPVGYADGWIRKNQHGDVLVDGTRCPIIGRICMDQFMVRLPKELPVGTKVTLIGMQKNAMISIDEIAKRLDTINYEIPCTINSRVPRIFLKNKSIIEVRNPVLQINNTLV